MGAYISSKLNLHFVDDLQMTCLGFVSQLGVCGHHLLAGCVVNFCTSIFETPSQYHPELWRRRYLFIFFPTSPTNVSAVEESVISDGFYVVEWTSEIFSSSVGAIQLWA